MALAPAPWRLQDLTPEVIPAADGSIRTIAAQRDGSRPGDPSEPTPEGELFSFTFGSDYPDWAPEYADQRYTSSLDQQKDKDNVPPGWDYYYTSELWHPNGEEDGSNAFPNKMPVSNISSAQSRIPGGKSLVIWDESFGGGSQWGADPGILKEFTDSPKVYVEFWILFDTNFVFYDVLDGVGQATYKLVRIGRYDGPADGNRFSFTSNHFGPYCIVGLQSYTAASGTNYAQLKLSNRTNPYSKAIADVVVQLPGTSTEEFLDGNWHKIGVWLEVNSAAGVADGSAEIYWDGTLVGSNYALEWNLNAADDGAGWNQFIFGGNANNTPYPESEQFEQWWALDDPRILNYLPDDATTAP